MKTTLKNLIEYTNIPEALIRATVRQCGGWESFTECAADVANHGADSGFSGFIYYSDTLPFTRRNRDEIAAYAEELARDLGDGSAVALVRGFRCLEGCDDGEIARALYGKPREDETAVPNALAWFALEEVALAYVNMTER